MNAISRAQPAIAAEPAARECGSCGYWTYLANASKGAEMPVHGHCHRFPGPVQTWQRHWCGEWRRSSDVTAERYGRHGQGGAA